MGKVRWRPQERVGQNGPRHGAASARLGTSSFRILEGQAPGALRSALAPTVPQRGFASQWARRDPFWQSQLGCAIEQAFPPHLKRVE